MHKHMSFINRGKHQEVCQYFIIGKGDNETVEMEGKCLSRWLFRSKHFGGDLILLSCRTAAQGITRSPGWTSPLTIQRKKSSFGLLTTSPENGWLNFQQVWKASLQMSLLKSRPQGTQGFYLSGWEKGHLEILHHPLAQGPANEPINGDIFSRPDGLSAALPL